MTIQVSVFLTRLFKMTLPDNLCGSHLQGQVICVTSVDNIRTLVVDVIGQLISDVIGRL